MTAIYLLPTWSKIIALLLIGAILGGLLTIAAVAISANANIPAIVFTANEESYYRGVYASCLVMAQIATGLDYQEFEGYCNKITAAGREVDAYNGQAPGYDPGSRMTFEGRDG